MLDNPHCRAILSLRRASTGTKSRLTIVARRRSNEVSLGGALLPLLAHQKPELLASLCLPMACPAITGAPAPCSRTMYRSVP